MANIDIGSLGSEVEKELTLYSKEIVEILKKEAKDHMSALVKQTKATAPVGTRQKHYKNSIKSKKVLDNDRGASYVWYVDGANYRLSHLLERGHANRDGSRTEGTHFIERASDPIIEDYVNQVEEAIKNGR